MARTRTLAKAALVLIAPLAAGQTAFAMDTLMMRDSSEFTHQINGDTNPSAIFGDVAWTTQDGIITLDRSLGVGNFGWNDILNHANGWTVEFRFRVSEPHTTGGGVFGIIFADSSQAGSYHAWRFSDVNVFHPANGFVPMLDDPFDFTEWTTVRVLELPGANGAYIWVNDVLVVEEHLSANNAFNRVWIGHNTGLITSGAVEIDYLRADTTGAYRPVPEPASFAVLSAGTLLLLRRRRVARA